MKRQRAAGCQAAAGTDARSARSDTHGLLRASSSRHDRIRFVNGESRDEGVINSPGQCCRLCAAAKPDPANMICGFNGTQAMH